MSANGQTKVKIGETELSVTLPDFATREELVMAWHEAGQGDGLHMPQRRVAAAAIGLCTSTGRKAKLDYAKLGCAPLVYGGAVYGYLREQGVDAAAIRLAGAELVVLCAESAFPREKEVEETANFTEPVAGST